MKYLCDPQSQPQTKGESFKEFPLKRCLSCSSLLQTAKAKTTGNEWERSIVLFTICKRRSDYVEYLLLENFSHPLF